MKHVCLCLLKNSEVTIGQKSCSYTLNINKVVKKKQKKKHTHNIDTISSSEIYVVL